MIIEKSISLVKLQISLEADFIMLRIVKIGVVILREFGKWQEKIYNS